MGPHLDLGEFGSAVSVQTHAYYQSAMEWSTSTCSGKQIFCLKAYLIFTLSVAVCIL